MTLGQDKARISSTHTSLSNRRRQLQASCSTSWTQQQCSANVLHVQMGSLQLQASHQYDSKTTSGQVAFAVCQDQCSGLVNTSRLVSTGQDAQAVSQL